MDFANLDLRAASERGSWVHFLYNGEPIYADEKTKKKPSRVHLKGIGEPKVMAATKAFARIDAGLQDRLSRDKGHDVESLIAAYDEKADKATNDLILAAVDKFENVIWNGDELKCTPENIIKLCGSGTLFCNQVTQAILDQSRLFTDAANG